MSQMALKFCHSGLDPESSLFNGFPLEFIPVEIEAGMTALSIFCLTEEGVSPIGK